MNLPMIITTVGEVIAKNAPQILTALGIGGFMTSIAFAVDATPDAYNDIKAEEARRVHDGEEQIEVKPLEAIKIAWKHYIPTAIMVIASSAMIIGGMYLQTRRTAALAAAYAVAADQANRYYENMKTIAGKTKAEEGLAKTAQDIVNDIPDEKFDSAPSIDGGEDYFIDKMSGRVFKHDIVKIREAVNKFNKDLLEDMWCSVNELYDYIGLERTLMGEILGYNIDKGLFEFRAPVAEMYNGKPVAVLMPANYPETRYRF